MNNIEERSRLEKYAPLGIELAKEVMLYVGTMTAGFLYSLVYIGSYIGARNQLFERSGGKMVLREGAKMPAFEELMAGRMMGFWLVVFAMAVIMIYHYAYHYMDSKLIYLMKRLPSKWEMHKRCLMLPIAGIVVTGIVIVLLWFIYLGIYLLFTPQQCLPF